MRNGDAYRIKSLSDQGVSDSDICNMPQFRKYEGDEILKFVVQKPKAKKKAKAKSKDE